MLVHQCRRLLRQRRFLTLTVIVTIMFLMYQLLSVGQLGKELSRRKIRPKLQTNFRSYEKADGFMQAKYPDEEKDVNKMKLSNHHYNQLEPIDSHKYIPGVLPLNQKLYFPTPRKTFRCIRSGEEISFSLVNDDFCDCSDFSDEPSTSACSYGKFYCTHQSSQSKSPISIISYKVNDGICDCCDGSDEWKSILLPDHTLVKANPKFGLQQPCRSHC